MAIHQLTIGEPTEVLSVKKELSISVGFHEHWEQYIVSHPESRKTISGDVLKKLSPEGVSVYLKPKSIQRPLYQADILVCEIMLLHWVAIRLANHQAEVMLLSKLMSDWVSQDVLEFLGKNSISPLEDQKYYLGPQSCFICGNLFHLCLCTLRQSVDTSSPPE